MKRWFVVTLLAASLLLGAASMRLVTSLLSDAGSGKAAAAEADRTYRDPVAVAVTTTTPVQPPQTSPERGGSTTPSTDPGAAPSCDVRCRSESDRLVGLLDPIVTGGEFGFTLRQLGGLPLADHNSTAEFYPASSIKVVHLVHALRVANDGELDALLATEVRVYSDSCLGQGAHRLESLEVLLRSMMRDSSNVATNAIQDHFGVSALTETIAVAGMGDTHLYHRFGCGGPANTPANTTTAADLAALYEAVAASNLIGDAGRNFFFRVILDAASSQLADLETGNLRLVANDATTHVYIKEGWYGNTLVAAGIITVADQEPYVYAAFVDGANSISAGFDIMQVVSQLVRIAGG